MIRYYLSVLYLICFIAAYAAENSDTPETSGGAAAWKEYLPHIHGVLRPRFEMDTENGKGRFALRHARLSLGSDIGPFDYFFNTDFCDQGKVKILDYYAGVHATRNLYLRMGQYRMPFGSEPFLGPATSVFANRSFIGKQICNFRAVGLKASWSFTAVPLSVEAGIFNPTPITEHIVWTDRFAYSGKATLKPGDFSLSAGMMSVLPGGIRMNLADVSAGWSRGRWQIAGEYMYEHYTHSAYRDVHGWLAYADYKFPVKAGIFNRMSVQLRYDGMTDHSSGQPDSDGQLQTDHAARNRVTGGVTISYIRSRDVHVDLRVNYEKYFYRGTTSVSSGEGDKALLDMVVSF